MPNIKITKKNIDDMQCEAGKDRTAFWDTEISGFGVVAYPSGKKVYVAQYRQDGRSRRATIGEHGILTPEQARTEAKKLLGAILTGADPIGERKAARAVRTFKEVADEFLTVHVKAKRARRTAGEYERMLNRDIYPALGSMRIIDVKKKDVAKLHLKISQTAPALANRVLAVVSSIWTQAAKRDEVDANANPARGLERNPERKVERYLSTEEFARIGEVLRAAETVGLPWDIDEVKASKHLPKEENRLTVIDPFAIAAIRLLLFTGARLDEIVKAKWSEFDQERGVIVKSKHKTSRKTGNKAIMLSAPALEVLANLPRIEGNDYIIAGKLAGKPRSDLNKPWAAIRRAAGLADMRAHDLRHSFASVGVGGNMALPLVGKLLGHTQTQTTARYAHLADDPLKKAANTIGAELVAKMGGVASGNVVAMKRGKQA